MSAPRFITIVSGLPRSGTSLMMQMLDAGGLQPLTDGARVPDEDNPKGYYEFEPVKRTRHDCSWVERAPGLAVKVIYAQLRYLPAGYRYRVILMRRDPEEVLSSQAVMLRRLASPGATLPPDRLANAFASDLADVLATLARRPEFQILDVNYRDCVYHPRDTATRLNGFLDGILDEDRVASVPDLTLYRHRAEQVPAAHHEKRI